VVPPQRPVLDVKYLSCTFPKFQVMFILNGVLGGPSDGVSTVNTRYIYWKRHKRNYRTKLHGRVPASFTTIGRHFRHGGPRLVFSTH
jgi:hypothetical protein